MTAPADDRDLLTAATRPGDAGGDLPGEARPLRESWLAMGQLLADADRRMSPPSLGELRDRLEWRSRKRRRGWLGSGVVAAGAAAGLLASLALRPPPAVELPKTEATIGRSFAATEAPPWDDQWENAVALVHAAFSRCQTILLSPAPDTNTMLLRARLDWLEAECQNEAL